MAGRPVGRWVWRDPQGRTIRSMTFAWTAIVERYTGEKLVESTTLTAPERIRAEEVAR